MTKALLDIRSLARTHSRTAIRALKSVAADKEQPGAARVAAAVALLDRGWGKPQQDHSLIGEKEITVTIRHLVEGMPDTTTKIIDVTPEKDDDES
jgi:hypothetical protein